MQKVDKQVPIRTFGWQALVRAAFGIAGVVVLVLLVRQAGKDALLEALTPVLPWLPALLVLDLLRIGADAHATWLAYGERAAAIPVARLLRAQLIANAVTYLAPAGRTAAEATKAALLARFTSWPEATAAATLMQALALFGGAVISVPCVLAAGTILGFSAKITLLILAQGLGVTLSGLVVRGASRSPALAAWLGRLRFRRVAEGAQEFHDVSRGGPLVPLRPLLSISMGRAFQVAQYGIIAHAVGVAHVSVLRALLAQGVNMVALAVGVLVPGQLGATDGAFALAAEALGTTMPRALAIALVAHVLQVIWIVVGTLVPTVWRVRNTGREAGDEH